MIDLTISVGDDVTLGLGTHDMEVQAWITFPKIGLTHEIDPRSSISLNSYREIKTPTRHFERMVINCVKKTPQLKGKVKEFRETEFGGILALVDLGTRQRWFNLYLLNNQPLGATGPRKST